MPGRSKYPSDRRRYQEAPTRDRDLEQSCGEWYPPEGSEHEFHLPPGDQLGLLGSIQANAMATEKEAEVRMIQSEMLGAHPLLCACLDRVEYFLPVQPTPGHQNQRKFKLKLAGHETQGRVSSEGSDAGHINISRGTSRSMLCCLKT